MAETGAKCKWRLMSLFSDFNIYLYDFPPFPPSGKNQGPFLSDEGDSWQTSDTIQFKFHHFLTFSPFQQHSMQKNQNIVKAIMEYLTRTVIISSFKEKKRNQLTKKVCFNN
jgi:hypothetical protein